MAYRGSLASEGVVHGPLLTSDGPSRPAGPPPNPDVGGLQKWRLADVGAAAIVFAAALLARLVPVVRGGGLRGVLAYDDGVYFGAAVALAHGRLPYRDFLLLHPPGIVVALLPFAGVGAATQETIGFATARISWMLGGSLTAVLVLALVRRSSAPNRAALPGALAAGLCYAVYPAAIQVEQTTLLEGLANLALVGALLLLTGRGRGSGAAAVGAGVLLGVGAATKIWGVVPVAVTLGYLLFVRRGRDSVLVAAGAAVATTSLCLPFYLAAPSAMWRMVVLDQLDRPNNGVGLLARVQQITASPLAGGGVGSTTVALALALLLLVACALVLTDKRLRLDMPVGCLAGLLFLGVGAMLLVTPSFFAHYAAAIAVPLAILVGIAVGRLAGLVPAPPLVVAATVLALSICVGSSSGALAPKGHGFPVTALRAVTAGLPGCVAADDANSLLQLNLMGRDADRGCVMVDLGGESYDVSRGQGGPRYLNLDWQRLAVSYLRSGSAVINTRFHRHTGFSDATYKTVHAWPAIARADGVTIRRPLPVASLRGQ